MAHVVWDWNGTLVADVEATIESINAVLAHFGIGPIDASYYARHYCRPVRAFYEEILGEQVSDDHWALVDRVYHDHYHARLGTFPLSEGAEAALAGAAGSGHSQSLLSMWSHNRLMVEVDRYGIERWFRRVDGSRSGRGDAKVRSLAKHLRELGLEGRDVVLIGDAVDDAEAAAAVGARSVLITSTHDRARLDRLGVPVIEELIEALAHLDD